MEPEQGIKDQGTGMGEQHLGTGNRPYEVRQAQGEVEVEDNGKTVIYRLGWEGKRRSGSSQSWKEGRQIGKQIKRTVLKG